MEYRIVVVKPGTAIQDHKNPGRSEVVAEGFAVYSEDGAIYCTEKDADFLRVKHGIPQPEFKPM